MTIIVLLHTTLERILGTGTRWHCEVNPEPEEWNTPGFVAFESESMMFKSLPVQPERSISQAEFAGIKEIVFKGGSIIRIYKRMS
jgi:hypothetical protein